MNGFINTMAQGNGVTANGAVTNVSSNSGLIDLLFLGGASRNVSVEKVLTIFKSAYNEDKTIAKKLLFYIRDIEEGMGERRFFRESAKYIINQYDNDFIDSLLNIESFRQNIVRVDDIIWLVNEELKTKETYKFVDKALRFLFDVLLADEQIKGIAAKWMPRKNSQYKNVVKFMRKAGYIRTYSEYRKAISSMTNVVEQQMSANKWDEINLEHVPSLAMKKYKKSFNKRELLKPYIEKVESGEVKINASKLFPNEIVKEIITNYYGLDETTIKVLNEQWKNLKKLNKDLNSSFRAIPVIDVSGSMTSPNDIPMSMSVGLGMFLAENNVNKEFKDYFITFSEKPKFDKIRGTNIAEKVRNLMGAEWGMSTNIESTFELILKKGLDNNIPQNEMPTHIIIISDMEFNRCAIYDERAIDMIRRRYTESGYEMPTIVFWNVNGRVGNVPVNKNDKGVLLVSGASQNIANLVLKQEYENLMSFVYEVVNKDRYSYIK